MRYGQLVLGPAGSGKSTYCSAMVKHCQALKRKVDVVNLDPAAESFDYQPIIDIREVINITELMEDDEDPLGPNGALVYAMEHFMHNLDWLQEQLDESDDDYLLFDVPGQIELFTHFDIITRLIEFLENMNFRICGIFLLDSNFVIDISKFISASFVSLSTMINIQIPFVNLLTKVDLLNSDQRKNLDSFLEFGPDLILEDQFLNTQWAQKYRNLTRAISTLVCYIFVNIVLF